MDIFEWIVTEFTPETCTTGELLYEHMDSQSDYSLPIIYKPFDPANGGHWADRGAALDFVLATQSQGGRVLDFGPGDGWPSLIIAPLVAEVIGVDGARRRIAACRANAERLGIMNATFEYVEPGQPLSFEDGSFDAVVAASSVEQSPDPRATLKEFYRVLRPGGRLRLYYEALARYRGESEREVWISTESEERSCLMLYDRHIDEEFAVQVKLTLALPAERVCAILGAQERPLTIEDVTVDGLRQLQNALVSSGVCTTIHPSGTTLVRWLIEIGFQQVLPSYDGIRFSGELFTRLPVNHRPNTIEAIDNYLAPIIGVVVNLQAPASSDPMITAVK